MRKTRASTWTCSETSWTSCWAATSSRRPTSSTFQRRTARRQPRRLRSRALRTATSPTSAARAESSWRGPR
eukprot:1052573-Pyramimonas_sp.AAC.1